MAIIGGLNSVPDVKVLLLYILNYAGGRLSREHLIRIALDGGTAAYFDIVQALEGAIQTGLIEAQSEQSDVLCVTPLGVQTLSVFENNLPYSVRRKNQSALLRLVSEMERQRLVKSSIIKKEHGYEAVCTLLDEKDVLLEYRLFVPTQIQAQMIVDQFEQDPIGKYKKILQQLIDEKLYGEDDHE